MLSPIFMILRCYSDSALSNRVILQLAYRQAKAMRYTETLAAALGALIVAVSSFVKIPQIKKLLLPKEAIQRAQLAAGILKLSVRLETFSQFVHVAYNKQHGSPFLSYGEALLLGLQNIALLMILEYYQIRKETDSYSVNLDNEQQQQCLQKLVRPTLKIAGVVFLITHLALPGLILALQLVNIPVAIAAKVPQIKRNAMLKSTAHLSGLTVGANILGSFARVLTTIANFERHRFGDLVLLAGYLTSFTLNSILGTQIYCYSEKKSD